MKRGKWRITHDPLGLFNRDVAVERLENVARAQGEDIAQAEVGAERKKKMLDLGWYAGAYHVLLVAGDWDAPIDSIETRDLESALAAFRRLMR